MFKLVLEIFLAFILHLSMKRVICFFFLSFYRFIFLNVVLFGVRVFDNILGLIVQECILKPKIHGISCNIKT